MSEENNRAGRTLVQFFDAVCNVKFPNLSFQRQLELITVNLSFSIFASAALSPVTWKRIRTL